MDRGHDLLSCLYFLKIALILRFSGQRLIPASAQQQQHTLELSRPVIAERYQSLQVIFSQHFQPWHPSSTLMNEAGAAILQVSPQNFLEFSAAIVVNKTRNQTYERLANIGESVGKADEVGHLNAGNKVTNDTKLMVKGIEEPEISSSFTATQWEQW
ncbi:hypothetical protein BJX99DRAFT_251201 [Aspergillus californicus]